MIPVLKVEGDTLPEVWERSVVELWKQGIEIMTEYGQGSKDCTMIMVVRRPLSEPRIHRAGLTIGRLRDLIEYVDEVLEGVRDHLVLEGKIPYTYHERLFAYPESGKVVDQVEYIVRKLKEAPYSRRAQAITWRPSRDTMSSDPPCLQRIWCRIVDNKLVMHAHWRSRDAFKAAFMNMYALTELQRRIAQRLSAELGRRIEVGEYVDISDSYHIYEQDYKRVEAFLKTISTRTWKDRVWTTNQYLSMLGKLGSRL